MIGNGVDLAKFTALPRADARALLGLPADAKVMVSVGTLVERKGFHRVIECMPYLLKRHPELHYLVVGGAGPEGDITPRLLAQVAAAGLQTRVHFLGIYSADRLRIPLSASDIFVLATGYEGWANVFLEAMGCGLPVVTTRVGGNAEVVKSPELGTLVELGDQDALGRAIDDALNRSWDRTRIVEYARSNSWEQRIPAVIETFRRLVARRPRRAPDHASLGTERA
jgi:glycosyltransferase involved in cell wall biosynthesis